jgi:outer membrane biogenesis lipoprotein LolB
LMQATHKVETLCFACLILIACLVVAQPTAVTRPLPTPPR